MKRLILASTLTMSLAGGAAHAQSGGDVRIQPGYFCAQNKCMTFSRDLSTVKIQSRRAASIKSYNLRSNPVVSSEVFREIFLKALYQPNITSVDR